MIQLIRKIFLLCVSSIFLLTSIMLIIIALICADLPTVADLIGVTHNPLIVIRDCDGVILNSYGDPRGQDVQLNEISDHAINALVALEDSQFWFHNGINLKGIFRALLNDLKELKLMEGGSSITQQLAKNLLFTEIGVVSL